MNLEPNTNFGQYRVNRLLGRGGMGEVYEVEHRVLERRYALKLLPADFARRAEAIQRFEREAKVMANLEHPHIVRVDEFGETDGRCWLRMELVRGVAPGVVTLADFAAQRGGRISQDEYAPILRQILEALACAHDQGVVHRDLKPGNILLEQTVAGAIQVKISDFGLARVMGEEFIRSRAQMSGTQSREEVPTQGAQKSVGEEPTVRADEGASERALLGTWEYMAPEQRRGEEADAASDIYAVGLMSYRLLTGKGLGLDLPSELVPGLAAGWDKFLEKALEQRGTARYANGGEMLAAMTENLEGASAEHQPIDAGGRVEQKPDPATELELPARSGRKSIIGAWAVALAVLALVAAVGWLGWYWNQQHKSGKSSGFAATQKSKPDMQGRWTNSLGQIFVPVPGTAVLFGIWDVRVQDFQVFVNATGKDMTNGMFTLRRDGWKQQGDTWKNPGFSQGPTHPVVGVSWTEAKAYCDWLTGRERAAGLIGENQSYRLPTDGEWSVAVGLNESNGGTPRDKNMKVRGQYPWGTQWPPPADAGNYGGSEANDGNWPNKFKTIAGYQDGYARTSPVGSFRANQFGLYDMGGNVWQWCEDYYDGQSGSRVTRGASWRETDPGRQLLSSFRNGSAPDDRTGANGFRCVLATGVTRDESTQAQAEQATNDHRELDSGEPAQPMESEKPDESTNLGSTARWTNSLGQIFAPVPGTKALFCIWDTRVGDYQAYAQETSGVDNSWQNPGFVQGYDYPVANVSWEEAKAYCAWLTQKERSEGKINDSQSYRLPTDAEWSVAVGLHEHSGGTPADKNEMTPDVYPWGTSWPPPNGAGNYGPSVGVDDFAQASPVGSFKANPLGLYDMGGNVWQWCEDWTDSSQQQRVLRGASWYSRDRRYLLSSSRGNTPVVRNGAVGFRCVLANDSAPAVSSRHDFWAAQAFLADSLGSNRTGGYCFVIRDQGKIAASGTGGYARMPWEKEGSGLRWTTDKTMWVGDSGFTTFAVLKLWEEKKLSLDEPFWPYVTNYFSHAHQTVRQITIRNLLAHQSGLDGTYDTIPNATDVLTKAVKSTPGTQSRWNGGDYFLLGLVLEQVSGENFSQYVKSHLLATVGAIKMDTKIEAQLPVLGYGTEGLEKKVPGYSFDWESREAVGEKNWFTSAADWSALLAGLFDGRILSADTAQMILKERFWGHQVKINGQIVGYSDGAAWGGFSGSGHRVGHIKYAAIHFNDGVDAVLLINSSEGNPGGLLIKAWQLQS